ncbi:hypothetical protein C5B85_08980 [Pseudoclavibacter sp. AY1F1]|uniref:hypothetical protein n=1 Tax=Pseudoclavibacter sp. AY1F1 TaxID=2080583 RepID=UPI000CE7BD5E|nr:hypothetical protein [Pseudoclavibacter sp. AY1F1]PPF44863.1 hypothetical protein C5B85_08980 [Pseudoclavibacter sp. AY1F1]
MIEWRFCGEFNTWRQDAVTDELSWIDEQEARRRYQTVGERLTVVPPVDETTGIVPYFIVITPGEHPSFTVVKQLSPAFGVGARASDVWWKGLGDGRLFAHLATVYEYGPYNPKLPPKMYRHVAKIETNNREDGTGWVNFIESNPRSFMSAERDSIFLDDLYSTEPTWGEWDALV